MCQTCSGSQLRCKPCPGAAARALREADAIPENWAYCTLEGVDPVLCVMMTAFANDDAAAAAWFVAQGHSERIRIVRVDDPAAVEWGDPTAT